MLKRLADRFFRWYCRPEYYLDIRGDIEELYHKERERSTRMVADLKYAREVLLLMRLSLIRPIPLFSLFSQKIMFANHIKIALRQMAKHKLYSGIKIGGFSLGIAACLLIALFIRDELSYDKHYKEGNRLYRLVDISTEPGNEYKETSFPAPINKVLQDHFPEIEKTGRLIMHNWFDAGQNQFRPSEATQNTYEEGFIYADSDLLEVLEIPLIFGEKAEALSAPNTIVVSKRKADKYFPGQNPVGKTVILNEDEENPYTIGGVMANFPANSHLDSDFILTLTGKEFWPGEQSNWCCWNYTAYIRLHPEADVRQVEKKLLLIRDDYLIPYKKEQGDRRLEEMKAYYSFALQPVSEIYLAGTEVDDDLQHGDKSIVWVFGIIAAIILLLACINFINLSTAKSANRAREVGLRKVVGSLRRSIINQFLTESLLFSLVSLGIGLLLTQIALPYFNLLANKSIVFPWSETWLFPILLGSIMLIGLLAGIYPSFYLSAFKPIQVLKGNLSRGSKGSIVRGSLVVFQFTVSIVLIICTLIAYLQMQYILNKKIGFDKDQVIMVQGTQTLEDKRAAFKDELERLAEVKYVSISSSLPVSGTRRNGNSFWLDGRNKIDKGVGGQTWRVDEDYLQTLGMNLLEGRNFSPERISDTAAVIINQTMAQKLGLQDPIGKRIMNWQTWHVIGVVEDFYYESLKGEIEPLCLMLGNDGAITSVKVQSSDMEHTLSAITAVWDEFMPNQPIRYTFLDQQYARMYEDVSRTGTIFTVFAALAIIVACLGLFALSAFMVEQRRKEVSIRKVLGASFGRLFGLLTLNFLSLVCISLVLAVPISWYAMNRWLEDYASNRVEISWEVFALAGVLTLGIALLTISYESIRVVRRNPADSLRSE